MDHEYHGASGTINTNAKKIQTEYSKQQKYLEKCASYNVKAIGKEEDLMRRNLEKLEKERERFTHTRAKDHDVFGSKSSSEGRRRSSDHMTASDKAAASIRPSIRDFQRAQSRTKKLLAQESALFDLKGDDLSLIGGQTSKTHRLSDKTPFKLTGAESDPTKHTDMPSVMPRRERRMSLPAPGTMVHDTKPGHASFAHLPSSRDHHDFGQGHGRSHGNVYDHHDNHDESGRLSSRISTDRDHEHESILLEAAIQTLRAAEENDSIPDLQRMSYQTMGKRSNSLDVKRIDSETVRELEEILQQTRHYKDRQEKEPDNHPSVSRVQRKRLERLEDILSEISKDAHTKFNPREMLECGYLRLSNRNIETLEGMIRDMGLDPGIHVHSDVANYDLFGEIKKEKEVEEEKTKQLLETGKKSQTQMRRGSEHSRKTVTQGNSHQGHGHHDNHSHHDNHGHHDKHSHHDKHGQHFGAHNRDRDHANDHHSHDKSINRHTYGHYGHSEVNGNKRNNSQGYHVSIHHSRDQIHGHHDNTRPSHGNQGHVSGQEDKDNQNRDKMHGRKIADGNLNTNNELLFTTDIIRVF